MAREYVPLGEHTQLRAVTQHQETKEAEGEFDDGLVDRPLWELVIYTVRDGKLKSRKSWRMTDICTGTGAGAGA